MNSLGRHYRDPADTANPTCDYENCNFFSSGHEFASLPYPQDISLGPVSELPQQQAPEVVQQGGDLARIMQMLLDQKEQSERTNNQMQIPCRYHGISDLASD